VKLPDNILTHYLRDVYFVSGGMCGGKTTISAYLSTKYELPHYNWDRLWSQHKAISDPDYQPEMHRHGFGGDWEAHFSRPPEQWAQSLERSIREQVEIALVDLIHRSAAGPIIVDGVFPCSVLKRVTVPERCVFLFATLAVMERDNLQREDKRDLLECIRRLKDPEQAKRNMYGAVELLTLGEMAQVQGSSFAHFVRDIRTDDEHLCRAVEEHFGFQSKFGSR
jgi:hypothetical protein